MIAANPNTGERVVVYSRPKAHTVYYQRPLSEFQKKFTKERVL
jgi:hypothetical protein